MKSPRPWSYHQKATAVAISRASSALATRLRSSVRCAISDIVAAASRGSRRRRSRGPLTVVLPGAGGSARAVGRAGLLGPGAQLGRARLGDAGLLVQLGGEVAVGGRRRAGGRDDLAADGRGVRRILRAQSPDRGVVVLHALHLALEDAQRAPERARGVRQLLVAEQEQDRQDDQADLQRTE